MFRNPSRSPKAKPIASDSKSTFIASPFPVHFCSAALMGAPCYTHLDAAPLRVLSRLLSSKYLHVEIREKGMYGTAGSNGSFMANCIF